MVVMRSCLPATEGSHRAATAEPEYTQPWSENEGIQYILSPWLPTSPLLAAFHLRAGDGEEEVRGCPLPSSRLN